MRLYGDRQGQLEPRSAADAWSMPPTTRARSDAAETSCTHNPRGTLVSGGEIRRMGQGRGRALASRQTPSKVDNATSPTKHDKSGHSLNARHESQKGRVQPQGHSEDSNGRASPLGRIDRPMHGVGHVGRLALGSPQQPPHRRRAASASRAQRTHPNSGSNGEQTMVVPMSIPVSVPGSVPGSKVATATQRALNREPAAQQRAYI